MSADAETPLLFGAIGYRAPEGADCQGSMSSSVTHKRSSEMQIAPEENDETHESPSTPDLHSKADSSKDFQIVIGGSISEVICPYQSHLLQVIIRSSAGPAREFALCEVEVQVAPVPCDLLLDKGWTIHGRVVLIFPPGEASRAKLEDAGEACERAGGSLVPSMLRTRLRLVILPHASPHEQTYNVVEATIDPSDAIVQAFALTFVSEIGDKTFFIAAILAAGSSAAEGLSQKVLTFIGAISALAVMTVIAVSIGQVFHAVPDAAGGLPLDDYASILAFGYFGVKLLLDASTMADDGSILAEEKEEAEEAVNSSLPEWVTNLAIPALVVQAFILVFAAEVGDRSFISAAALSAQGGPEGAAAVFVGAIAAHAIATLLAVALGDLISTYVSASLRLEAVQDELFVLRQAGTLGLPASFAPHPRSMASAREDKAKMASSALRKLMALSKSGSAKSGSDAAGSREQASLALRELCRGLVPKSGEQDINEMDAKFQALLEKILAQRGELAPAPVASAVSAEDPLELAEKLGPEPVEAKKPEPLRRRLVLTEEGGMLASVRVKVLEASKALRAKDNMVTQLTQKLKQCRKEVWDLQCEANAADLRVARILQQNSEKLPEKYRREFEELKEKEEELADVLAVARAEAQRWASVAKRQDAMLQQEREEQRGADAKSILMKHPAGEVFWMPGPDSDSEDDAAMMQVRRRAEDVNLGSSDEDSDRQPTRADLAKAKARFEAERRLDDSDSPSDDSIDEVRPIRSGQGAVRETKQDKEEATSISTPPATKAVPPLPGLSSLPGGRPGYDDVEEVYSDDSISEDIQMSSRSM
ncbi:unnamed protein product [Symbiodinium sp. KB8]|nr:unnamed protein product [Symbiodinium sp. KB8]